MSLAATSGWPMLADVIDRFAVEAPAAVARGRAALHGTLAPLDGSAWPEVAWRFSDIAPGGFPAELIWRPGCPGLFWTAEPAPPEIPAKDRMPAALRRLDALGTALPSASVALARRAAVMGNGRGIWLGGRHDADGDRYKLYVGTGPTAADLLREADAWRPMSTVGLRLFHLGLDSTGRVELYWRRRRYEPGDLASLGRTTNLVSAASRLRAGLATLCGRDPDLALEGRRLAYSVQIDSRGLPEALALFCALPASFLGGEHRTLAWLEAQVGVNVASVAAILWRQGLLRPSWIGVTATTDRLSSHIGFMLRAPGVTLGGRPGA
ncbi:hypothetical protein GCM10011504_46550 [Siccirubricoccus deserti]|uniref:Uncharacterized protein n=1 Tax=Siccirubricoccus deserti TaxID=2013562 RepID=A0A9X0R3F7_9PROT|nr:hypothetical protein [Siccirubricoccus deserti]MBC4018128.1 hypothetical protein [Siccirubricoccus deserti]GGC63039.1 hypothetical protein GCM10011504_46550 [Siccirubricoccus deserti]